MGIGGGHPGKFPAKLATVTGKTVVLEAVSAEDVEYLTPFIGEVLTVDITPDHGHGEHASGPEPETSS